MFEEYRNRPEPFRDELGRFIYTRTYSRWLEDYKRRETWFETVSRVCTFLFKTAGDVLTDADKRTLFLAIYDLEVLPSMRLMWSAGEAAEANNVTAYNCSFQGISDPVAFDETLFILMCGAGAGASVEYEYVEQLPRILLPKSNKTWDTHVVEDSRAGWAMALRTGIDRWYHGYDVDFDFSGLRPAGARLKTMGGRSSGPEPLKRLLAFVRAKFQARAGRRLQTIDVADILGMEGEVVEMGGVRRSSEMILFSPDDPLMMKAKQGAFYNQHPYRRMANNSMAYEYKPDAVEFMAKWTQLAEGGSGEPGVFIRSNVLATSPRRRKWNSWGTNPCGEILLRGDHPLGGGQFCNLSEAVVRGDDTPDTLRRKIRLAAILGTIQSKLTHFPYLREGWKANCEEERLLGVSATGQADNRIMDDPDIEAMLRDEAIVANQEWSKKLGINPSTAVTCVKPSGTASQLVSSSSGLHVRWAPYYIRRVRISTTDPLLTFMKTIGVPCEPEVGQEPKTATTWVLSFPVKSPEGAKTRKDVTALQQCESWLVRKKYFTEHNPSCTIYVKSHEWIAVMNWVYEHWGEIGGLSFLPSDDHVYRLAPYEEITKEQYEELVAAFPKDIDYSILAALEDDDNTSGGGNGCEGSLCEVPAK